MLRQHIGEFSVKITSYSRTLLIGLLKGYRYFISPWLGNQCRFYPSCSAYSQQAISELGIFKGLCFTVWRLLRCHPWHPGGYDPVINKRISS